MYSYTENSAGGNFTSEITHKVYRFLPSRDGSDKKRAKRELDADHAQIKTALTDRLGREPTPKEMRNGVQPTDSRTLRERIAEDASIVSSPKRDPEVNPYTDRLVELQNQHPQRWPQETGPRL